jgi:hypothetical protein
MMFVVLQHSVHHAIVVDLYAQCNATFKSAYNAVLIARNKLLHKLR